MPYYVHLKESDPSTGTEYLSKQDAHVASRAGDNLTVSFVLSPEERIAWREREYHRFINGEYHDVPWVRYSRQWTPYSDGVESDAPYPKAITHFAHLSLKTPGSIAYTPSDEHGVQDRQVTIKVGRYLTEFYVDYMSTETIASYVDRIKSFSEDLKLARSSSEIRSVYVHGPNSCMSANEEEYCTGDVHPVEVYGDSDLAIAYLGTLERATARCIVWPEKKLYSRLYGDTTLRVVLESAGYSKADTKGNDYPQFDGATVRAIRCRRGWIMPYVDCAESADLSRDEKTFTLRADTNGDYETKNTNGLASEANHAECDHCGERCDDGETYCDSCNDDRVSCDRCESDMFDGDSVIWIDERAYCEHCADSHYSYTCEADGCNEQWYSRTAPDSNYCDDCADHIHACNECDDTFDDRCHTDASEDARDLGASDILCDDCYSTRCDTRDRDAVPDAPEYAGYAVSITVTPAYVNPNAGVYPTFARGEVRINRHDGQSPYVSMLYHVGCIAVHRTIHNPRTYAVTHILTGLAIQDSIATREEAIRRADLFASPGIDWNYRTLEEMPESTRATCTHIRQYGHLPSPHVDQFMATRAEVSL